MTTYTAHIVATDNSFHSIKVTAASSASVKTAARNAAKAQGITVKYVESFFIAA